MIARSRLLERVEEGLRCSPVTALLGPRQSGKTTLAREVSRVHEGRYFDLERPGDRARLQQPETVLGGLRGLVVLDEIQRMPELLPVLRVLADREGDPCRFLLLGSASPDLVKGASESLAGRVFFVRMGGFSLAEVGVGERDRLWVRGGFPPAFLAGDGGESVRWREDFIQTFLERDLGQLGVGFPAETMRRFWMMVAHSHGQLWNGSEIGRSLGVSHHASRRYLDALCGAYVLRQVQPWFENLGKRLVKSPKVFVRDSGLLHALLGLADLDALQGHPKLGASWEGFCIEEVIARCGERNVWFWATQGGAELDLLVLRGGRRWGFECKYQEAPRTTRSMHIARADLKLDGLWVIYPGAGRFPLADGIECVGLGDLGDLPPFR